MLEINKIYHGDCLEVMRLIDSKSIDMILCDLPYGITKCKWDIVIPFDLLWKQYKRIIKYQGVIALFGNEPFSSMLRVSNLKMFRYDWIWEKDNHTNFLNIKNQPAKRHEIISIFYMKQPKYNPQMWHGNECHNSSNRINIKREYLGGYFEDRPVVKSNKKYPLSIIKCNGMGRGVAKHPTQKPIRLCEYLIKTYTDEGDLVLDNCAGSGTTGIACKNLNRDFILIEKDNEYYELAKNELITI